MGSTRDIVAFQIGHYEYQIKLVLISVTKNVCCWIIPIVENMKNGTHVKVGPAPETRIHMAKMRPPHDDHGNSCENPDKQSLWPLIDYDRYEIEETAHDLLDKVSTLFFPCSRETCFSGGNTACVGSPRTNTCKV